MLVAFTFEAQPGKEEEFERLLADEEMGRRVAGLLGAKRNTLFLGRGRMIRVIELEEDAPARTMVDAARADEEVARFLRELAPLVKDGFDPDDPESFRAFNQRVGYRLAYDVRP